MEVIAIGESMVSLVNEPAGYIRHSENFKPHVAGAETNALIGLSRLGHKTAWMTALGKDELGEMILHKVRAENVDTSKVIYKNFRTGIFFKQITPDSSVDVTYYRENSAASKMEIEDIDIEYIKKTRILYLTGITLSLSESTRNMLFALVKQLKGEVKIAFDPNIRLKMWSEEEARKRITEFLPFVDYLIIGRNEVDVLLGEVNPEEAIDTFKEIGCGNIVLKLGKDGAVYDFDSKRNHIKNPKQFNEIDPVGAGDAFASGILSGILKKEPPDYFVEKACLLGGYITQSIGDYQGFPSEAALSELLSRDNEEKVNR